MTDDQKQTDPGVLRRLLGADGPELSCEQCFAQLDRYVELELGGEDADAGVPGMRAHLEGCAACDEDHRSLRAMVEADPTSRKPPLAD
jgi:hypothetical protein